MLSKFYFFVIVQIPTLLKKIIFYFQSPSSLSQKHQKIVNLLEINKLLTALNKSRNPVSKKILQDLTEKSKEIRINDILSINKANDDIIMAMFSTSYKKNFSLLISLMKCIKDMIILIEAKFTPKSNEYLKEEFNFWKSINVQNIIFHKKVKQQKP